MGHYQVFQFNVSSMLVNPWIPNTWENQDVLLVHGEVSLICLHFVTHSAPARWLFLLFNYAEHLTFEPALCTVSYLTVIWTRWWAAPPWILHYSLPWNNYICAFSLSQSLPICWTAIGKQVVILAELSLWKPWSVLICGSIKTSFLIVPQPGSTPGQKMLIEISFWEVILQMHTNWVIKNARHPRNTFNHLSLGAI